MLLIFLISLSSSGERQLMAKEDAENIEIINTSINCNQSEFPRSTYIYLEFKNNNDKDVANINFQIAYYDVDDCLIKKIILKNKFNDVIPSGKVRKYKIRLNCDVFNEKNEEFPYLRRDEVNSFEVKILNVRFAKKR